MLDKLISAAPISALSAIGSAILPKSVTGAAPTRNRAVDAVGQRGERQILPSRRNASRRGRRARSAAAPQKPEPSTAARQSARSPDWHTGLRRLGSSTPPSSALQPAPWPSRATRHSSGSATRSAPSAPTTTHARRRSPARRFAARQLSRRNSVVPSTSGAWWSARPSTSGRSDGASSSVTLTRSTRTSTIEPIRSLRALADELLDEPAEPRSRSATTSGSTLSGKSSGLRAVFVGVTEHADDVEAGGQQEVFEFGELGIGLTGESDDDVRPHAGFGGGARTRSSSSRNCSRSPNRRMRRSTLPLACWNDRSKYGDDAGCRGQHVDQ